MSKIKQKLSTKNASIPSDVPASEALDASITLPPMWLLKESHAPKVSKFGKGEITYQILADMERTDLLIAITGNKGGGYFSREKITFRAVEACLTQIESTVPFPSSTFKHAFTGRSSNNAGFLVAILRAEGLINATSGPGTKYEQAGDWSVWRHNMLAEPGTLIEAVSSTASDETALSDKSSGRKTLRLPAKKTEEDGEIS